MIFLAQKSQGIVSNRLTLIRKVSSRTTVRAGVAVIPHRRDGAFLIERRADCGLWGLVGGKMNPGETVRQTACRECREETGLFFKPERLLGIYSNPSGRLIRFVPSGDERHILDIVLIGTCRGKLVKSPESAELAWFTRGHMPSRRDFLRAAWEPLQDYLLGKSSFF